MAPECRPLPFDRPSRPPPTATAPLTRLLLAFLLLALLFLPSCGGSAPSNVVLVTIDTLRADHLSLYGYERETMPGLREWVDEAATFESCYTPLPLTDPSMTSIMTGRYPIRHRVRHSSRRLPFDVPTLAQVLKANGYHTAAFVSRKGLGAAENLGRGFDVTDFHGGGRTDLRGARAEAERWQRRAKDVTDAALRWLKTPPEKPFFLWLHYFDPHAFYDPPEPFRYRFVAEAEPVEGLHAWWGSPSDLAETVALYDGEILTADHHLARVVERLRARRDWDSTLFIVTSDHGESLGDHGHLDHGEWLYQEQVRVPLLMRYPGRIPAGLRVSELVRLIDLAPTILDLIDLRGPILDRFAEGMDGKSFAPLLAGEKDKARRIFIESENCPPLHTRANSPGMICDPPGVEGKIHAVFDGRFKLILTPTSEGRIAELYDLQNDPGEAVDLSERDPERLRALEAAIDAFWAKGRPPAAVDPTLRDQLRALGYVE